MTVKLELPGVVGVPDSTPVEEFRLIPAGRPPLLTDHVYGPVPPVTVSVSEYAALTSPAGGAGKLSAGPDTIVSDVAWVADRLFASVTFTVKLDVPAADGVPDNTPVEEFRLIPAGRLPALTDQA
jgi:hypothetical protein